MRIRVQAHYRPLFMYSGTYDYYRASDLRWLVRENGRAARIICEATMFQFFQKAGILLRSFTDEFSGKVRVKRLYPSFFSSLFSRNVHTRVEIVHEHTSCLLHSKSYSLKIFLILDILFSMYKSWRWPIFF